MKTTLHWAVALAALLPFAASAGILGGSKPPSDDVLRKRAADAIGFDPEEIAISDVVKEDVTVRFKAQLADGTQYRCTTASFSGLVRIASFGGGGNVSADCVKRPGSGNGPEPRENPLKAASSRAGK